MIKYTMLKKHLFLVFIFISAIAARAQSLSPSPNRGRLSGIIVNDKGKGIPKVLVQLLNSNFNTLTSAEGEFGFENLALGTYEIQLSASGYLSLNKRLTINDKPQILDLTLIKSDGQLQEVTVYAQKKVEVAALVPLSMTVFSSAQLRDQKIWNIQDLSGRIPNFYAAHPGDGRNVVSIRGITTSSYDPTVATYIDGVNQFGLDTYLPRLQDVERIEVLRGPQGTLYGRNAMGGVINITTKQPGNATDGFAEASFGSYGLQRYQVGLRSPVLKDRLFFGASALYTQQNGFFINDFTHSSFDDQRSFSGNYYLKYLAGSAWSAILNVKHNENRNDGAFPLAASIEEAFEKPFVLQQNNTAQMVDNSLNASLSLSYSGSDFNFISQTAYQKNYRYYKQPIDADFSPLDVYSIISDYGRQWNTVKVLTQEFRFSSAANNSSPFDWLAGLYGFHQRSPVKQGTYYGNDGPLVGAPANFTQINTNIGEGTGFAVFGQGSYKLTSQLNFSLGLRYDYEHKIQRIRSDFQSAGTPLMPGLADTAAKANFHAFSPKAVLQYMFGPAHHVFASYTRGFRAGGISSLGSDPSTPPLYSYKPEFSNNLEIGSKNSFTGNRLRINAFLFYTSVNHAQVPVLLLPDAIVLTRNVGKLHSKGGEIEILAVPVKGLEVDCNLGVTDAKYSNLLIPDDGAAVPSKTNRQIFTPNYTTALALQYSHELSTDVKIIARGEIRKFGTQYFDLENTLAQKGYEVFNSRVGLVTKRVELFVWGTNLGDKRYIDYAYNFGPAHLGNPRTFGITLQTSF